MTDESKKNRDETKIDTQGHVAQALMLDPLTAASCTPAQIKEMTERLFAAEEPFLQGYK